MPNLTQRNMTHQKACITSKKEYFFICPKWSGLPKSGIPSLYNILVIGYSNSNLIIGSLRDAIAPHFISFSLSNRIRFAWHLPGHFHQLWQQKNEDTKQFVPDFVCQQQQRRRQHPFHQNGSSSTCLMLSSSSSPSAAGVSTCHC